MRPLHRAGRVQETAICIVTKWARPVHVKTLTSQKRRALLTARKLLTDKAIAIENDIRGLLRNFGLKELGAVKFEERIRELTEGRGRRGRMRHG